MCMLEFVRNESWWRNVKHICMNLERVKSAVTNINTEENLAEDIKKLSSNVAAKKKQYHIYKYRMAIISTDDKYTLHIYHKIPLAMTTYHIIPIEHRRIFDENENRITQQ